MQVSLPQAHLHSFLVGKILKKTPKLHVKFFLCRKTSLGIQSAHKTKKALETLLCADLSFWFDDTKRFPCFCIIVT